MGMNAHPFLTRFIDRHGPTTTSRDRFRTTETAPIVTEQIAHSSHSCTMRLCKSHASGLWCFYVAWIAHLFFQPCLGFVATRTPDQQTVAGGSGSFRRRLNPLRSSMDDEIGVGIDLGTTNSAVAYLDDEDRPTIIPIPGNGRTMKSVVALDARTGETLVGQQALDWEQAQDDGTSAYRHVKRVIGTGVNFLSRETINVVPHVVPSSEKNSGKSDKKKKKKKKPSLQRMLQDAEENPTMLYTLQKNEQGRYEAVSPETISAAILDHLLEVATTQTQKRISRAVIGVPAYFNDAQREATIRAANNAGIDKVKLLREPEAAALAYGIDQGSQNEELVLVFDLGGGTYDVSILLVEQGLTEIVCTSGDAQLGGSNFDARIAARLSSLSNGCCTSSECSDAMVRAAESVRIYLSNNRCVNLALPLTEEGWLGLADPSEIIVEDEDETFEVGSNNSTHAFVQWTRKEVEQYCQDELLALLRPIREVAIMAGALLPGDARPSIVESAIEMEEAFVGAEKFYADDALDTSVPEEIPPELQQQMAELDNKAAKKAQQKGRKKARQVAKQERKYRAESRKVNEAQMTETQVRADGISGRPIARVVLVGGATRMPAIGRLIAALTGVTPQKTVDPDEAVALGCAVHVGVLDGNEKFGTVLNPMQAALLRAVVEKQRRDGELDESLFDDEDDFGDYDEIIM